MLISGCRIPRRRGRARNGGARGDGRDGRVVVIGSRARGGGTDFVVLEHFDVVGVVSVVSNACGDDVSFPCKVLSFGKSERCGCGGCRCVCSSDDVRGKNNEPDTDDSLHELTM